MARFLPLKSLAGLLFFALFALGFGASQPKLLIVQNSAPKVKDVDLNIDISDYVAQALDDDGRVSTIVWSYTDPNYRAALDAGTIKPGHEKLSHAEALAAAKALGCEYLLVVEGRAQVGVILVKAELFHGDRSIWRDPSKEDHEAPDERITELYQAGKISRESYNAAMQVKGFRRSAVFLGSKFSTSGTLRSVARTWVEELKNGTLKGLAPKAKLVVPDPSPGQVPVVPVEPVHPSGGPPKPREVDNTQIFASVAAAVKAGRSQDAILILREAVDAEPLDLPRRRALVKQLSESGYSDLASKAAVLASVVVPDRAAFKLVGAQAAIASGQFDVAQTQAMEVLAKEPESPAPQTVLGEIALYKGDYPGALERFNVAAAKGGIGEVYGYRAFAKAFTGDADGAVEDWNTGVKAGLNYALWPPFLNLAASHHFSAMKALLPKVAAKAPQDQKALLDEVHGMRLMAEATARLLATIVPPVGNSKSHARRVLAYQLLAQALGEVETALPKADDDAMSDARINFGEALKQWDAALVLAKGE